MTQTQTDPAAPQAAPDTPIQSTQEGAPSQTSQEASGSTQVVLDRPDHITPAKLPEARLEALSSEIADTGSVSEGMYRKMSGLGLSRTDVDRIVEGEKARLNEVYGRVADAVGGSEGMAAIKDWASQLPPGELAEVNKALASTKRDPAALELVWRGLQARHQSTSQGSTAGLAKASSGNPGAPGPAGFATQAEMMAAMNDARYRTDSTFQAQVHARVGNTPDRVVNGL